jgi:hypothetical protein
LAATEYITKNLSKNNADDSLDGQEFYNTLPADELYRRLYIRLSEMDVQKYINLYGKTASQNCL